MVHHHPSLELFLLENWNSAPILSPATPGTHRSTFSLYDFDYSKYLM